MQGQMDGAGHVIKQILNPLFTNKMASYDVASTIHQAVRLTNKMASYDVASTIHQPVEFTNNMAS